MELSRKNHICFGATLVCLGLLWFAEDFRPHGILYAFIAGLGCSLMFLQTNRRLHIMEAQNRLLDQVVQHIPGAIFWKDSNSTYLGCNGSFANFAGYDSPSDLIGHTDLELQWKKTEAQLYHASDMEVMLSRDPVVNKEISYRIRNGTKTTLLANKVPLLDEHGNVSGVLGMFQDITAQKELERALTEAKKLESLGQLSAGIAHEINTPMQCILINISFIKDSYERLSNVVTAMSDCLRFLDPKVAAEIRSVMQTHRFEFFREQLPLAIEEANEASSRVTEVISAMTYMAHPSNNERHALDLNQLITNALTISRNSWKDRAEVAFDFEESLPTVDGVQGALSQVLLNLVGNACDSIESGGRSGLGRLLIRTRPVNNGVQIDVQDNGTGIPQEIVSRVFDPFFTTKEVGTGTGQGLAISYDIIVNRHAGRISVDSQVGVGSTFSIWLPCSLPA